MILPPYKYELHFDHPQNLLLTVEDLNDGLTYSAYLSKSDDVLFYLNGTTFFTKFPGTIYKDCKEEGLINSISLMIAQLKGKIKNPENFKDDDLKN